MFNLKTYVIITLEKKTYIFLNTCIHAKFQQPLQVKIYLLLDERYSI